MIRVPQLDGVIRRRILVNYHADAQVVQRLLPEPFQPKLHNGLAMAGICLIRLEQVRPKFMPATLGLKSENAAHRVAVCWTDNQGSHEGVYIPRRDSNSMLNYLLGGRLFPGAHHRAVFDVQDDGNRVELAVRAVDKSMQIDLRGNQTGDLPKSSVFSNIQEASDFFKFGALGYSATAKGNHLDGLVLETRSWQVAPFEVTDVSSSYFSDLKLFPSGSAEFDCALIMRNIEHSWRSAPDLATVAPCASC